MVVFANFTSFGQDSVSVIGVNMTGDLGTWSLPDPPVLLGDQSAIVNTTVEIPAKAFVGMHSVTMTVRWAHQNLRTGLWYLAPDISITGNIPVLARAQSAQAPNRPWNPLTSLFGLSIPLNIPYGVEEDLFLSASAAYVILVLFAIAVLARDKTGAAGPIRERSVCKACGAVPEGNAVFCGTCGAKLIQ